MIVVSKCLLGYNCKYNGKSNYNQFVIDYLKNQQFIAVCPEELGGLSTPRIPSECFGNLVRNEIGQDVSNEFNLGATFAYSIIHNYPIDLAILKAKSPSCGNGMIYDGSFSKQLIQGKGKFATILADHNIPIFNEDQIKDKS